MLPLHCISAKLAARRINAIQAYNYIHAQRRLMVRDRHTVASNSHIQ
jgi:hypothetical protein